MSLDIKYQIKAFGSNIAFKSIIGYKSIALKGGKNMSVLMANIKKFMEDHKEQFPKEKKQQTLKKAQSVADLNGGLIMSGEIKKIFDDPQIINLFFKEIQSLEHVQIFSEENFGKNH